MPIEEQRYFNINYFISRAQELDFELKKKDIIFQGSCMR
jgi:hypothetical protein